MNWFKPTLWTRAALLALPVIASQVALTQLQMDAGLNPMSAALAADGDKKPERETRRTPALRNKVYEKLSEAQVAAEAKDLGTAQRILDEMVAAGGKKALNSYELANVYNLYAFIQYSREDYAGALRSYGKVVSQPDIPLAMDTPMSILAEIQATTRFSRTLVTATVPLTWGWYLLVHTNEPRT